MIIELKQLIFAAELHGTVLEIHNKYFFTNLKDIFEAVWTLHNDEVLLQSGSIPSEKLDIGPRSKGTIEIPFSISKVPRGSHCWLNIEFKLNHATKWAPNGYMLASEQFEIKINSFSPLEVQTFNQPIHIEEAEDNLEISSDSFVISFSKRTGKISSFEYKEEKVLKSSKYNFWRAVGIFCKSI